MFLRVLFLLILNSLLIIGSSSACGVQKGDGFLPKNNLRIPSTFFTPGKTMTEATFNKIISDVEAIYRPLMAAQGKELVIHRLWKNPEVNAQAYKESRESKYYELDMFGGLARHPAITPDAFALVVCHELGHHLAGAPAVDTLWGKASNEGQADYFATTKCIRKYFAAKNNMQQGLAGKKVSTTAQSQCQATWGKTKDFYICLSTSMASQSLADLFAASERSMTNAQFDTPSDKVVTTTYNDHPAAQCRLDTYFQGSLCKVSQSVDFSSQDASKGACNSYAQMGARPKCWYKPSLQSESMTTGSFQNRRI